jgi:hypothetical protein
VAVTLALQGLKFLLALVGIGIGEVFPYHTMAVTEYIGYQQIEDVA